MKLIGLIGGVSPASTAYYYRVFHEMTRERLGGHHSARLLIHSVDFDVVESAHLGDRWPVVAAELTAAARSLEQGGAQCVLLCCNTMHDVADEIAAAVSIPFRHIGDDTAEAVARSGLARVGLLGTSHTMEHGFYAPRLEARGIDVVVPDAAARARVQSIIYDELCAGRILDASRAAFREIVAAMVRDEAIQGLILGCTEIGLLLDPADVSVPTFDTARLHAAAALDWALGD